MLENVMSSLPKQLLEDVLEPEMAKQYRILRGQQCLYMPVFTRDVWLCSCGEENPAGRCCGHCGLAPEPLTRQVLQELSSQAQLRLEQEEAEAARAEEKRQQEQALAKKQARKQKMRRICITTAAIVAALAMVWGIAALAVQIWIPAGHYQKACRALEAGQLQLAHREFTLAGDYQDARARLACFYTPVSYVRAYYYEETPQGEELAGKSGYLRTYQRNDSGQLVSYREEPIMPDSNGQLVGTGEVVAYLCTYDEAGNPLTVEDFYGKSRFVYDDHGSPLTEDNFRPDGVQEKAFIRSYRYDDAGRVLERSEICSELISVNYSYEQHDRYTYDSEGRVTQRITESNFPAYTENNYISRWEYTYDSQGRQVEMVNYATHTEDSTNDWMRMETWEYDDAGRITLHVQMVDYAADKTMNSVIRTVQAYDEQGNLVLLDQQTDYPYDQLRNSRELTQHTYDKNGNLLKTTYSHTFANPEWQINSGRAYEIRQEYDFLGRCVSRVEESFYDRDEEATVEKTTYTYHANGILKETLTTHSGSGDSYCYSARSLYDENGLKVWRRWESDGEILITETQYDWYYFPDGQFPQEYTTQSY